ncbi:hypothetical protein Pcac1_g27775 [Phytophthora cactorum]|nr:hypothetical protein Pcac1_g27775 [Phytophthora cactorum]
MRSLGKKRNQLTETDEKEDEKTEEEEDGEEEGEKEEDKVAGGQGAVIYALKWPTK